MSQIIFGGIIAIILLGFYVWSIIDAVSVVQCKREAADCAKEFSNNMSYILNTIGALISSTVVGVLGATRPSEFPARKIVETSLKGKLNETAKKVAALMPSFFILFWLVCGVVTVIYGFILSEKELVPPFTAAAKAWFGIALAAAYAYLGIRPNDSNKQKNSGE